MVIHHFTLPETKFIPVPKIKPEKMKLIFEQRNKDIENARLLFPLEPDAEKAYKQYCLVKNIEFIPYDTVHHHKAVATEQKRKESKKFIPLVCSSCGKKTVMADDLCPSCPQFAQGYRTSLLCNNCLLTTFSAKTKAELTNEYLNGLNRKIKGNNHG